MRGVLLLVLLLAATAALSTGARADGGWIGDTFEEDATVGITPQRPTSADTVQAILQVKDPTVTVKVAFGLAWVKFPGSATFLPPANFTFVPFPDSPGQRFFAILHPAYPNGTQVVYQVTAVDFSNEPRTSAYHNYTIEGKVVLEVWKAETFEGNVNLTWSPTEPQPNGAVSVRIASVYPEVTIGGANLNIVYQYFDRPAVTGGFPFTREGDETMVATIPGYPAGTSVTFWVTAWDLQNHPLESAQFNYSLSLSRYTSNPPDRYPQPEVMGGGAIATALAVPLVVRYTTRRRR